MLAILAYHKIGEPPPGEYTTWNYVPEATFCQQLAQLAELGWTPIDHACFSRGLSEPETVPERAALLTFDDGYRSMRTVVLPVLERLGVPATLFVPTSFVGGTNRFDEGIEPEEPICDWPDLATLERAGVSVQSHGVTHRHFSNLSPAEQREELQTSKATLERHLGAPVDAIAFPYGDAGDPEAMADLLAASGYGAAFLYGGGPSPLPVQDRYRIPRVAMGPDSDLEALLPR
jgi:peptidoglycan/xylan/chitin deacetylase (PgdA/CDA1 family)